MNGSRQAFRTLLAIGVLSAQCATAAPFAYISETGIGNVRVIDTATNATVANVQVGFIPFGVAVNAARSLVYVANAFDDTVSVIDATTNRVVATIAVGVGPTGVAVNPAGTRLYVANSGDGSGHTVSVINAVTDKVIRTVEVGSAPLGLAVSPDGARLYVANLAGSSISVIDAAESVIDAAEYETLATIGVATLPAGLAIDAAGARLYATQSANGAPRGNVLAIDTKTNAIAATVEVGANPLGIALNPAGTRAYVANAGNAAARGDTVSVIDTASLTVIATVPVGAVPQGIAVHPSGGRVYVTNTDGDTVSVIDAATNTVTATLPVGPGPVSMGKFIGPAQPAAAPNYQGLWWNSPAGTESGWGINITHQGDTLFATWFTYDTDGSGLWLVMSNGARAGSATYSGTLFRTTGPAFDANPWERARVATTAVGNATLTFSDANNGTFEYTLGAVTQSKAITRQVFSGPVPACAAGGNPGADPSYQDLWWHSPAGSESGWGVNITHQGDILFATWFTYGAGGKGQWLVMSNGARTGNATYSGTLFRTTGPAFDASPWDPARVARIPAGSATFTFGDANNGTFAYTLDGVSQAKPITRQVFASPPTVCR